MFSFGIAARGSFRRQIILTFVVGFLGLAVTFAVYMVSSERDKLYRDSREMATGLGQSLAVSSRSWVLANDVVGMQEVVNAFRDYPELRYAMVISPAGRVLAHSDTTKVGQYVADEKSLALLKSSPGSQIMRDDSDVVDVVLPVEVGERHVGWVRVALERTVATNNLYQLAWSVALFVLVVTAFFLIAALLVMKRLGRRIDSLVGVARAVQAGNFSTRMTVIPADEDEIVRLGTGLNLMLDVLARNEEKLRASTHYTRSLIEASLDPLVTISPAGKITDVNLATEKVTGRSRDELVGTDFSEYFTEPDKARAGYQKVFARGEVTDFPLAMRHRDGHVTEVLYNASIYRNESGAVQGVFAAARDVSGQQRAELLQAQLAAIVESSNDAIMGKTLEGTITSWNKGAEKIYGYSAEEIIGKPVSLLAPAEQHAEMHRLLETVRNGGTVLNHEAERQRKDGTRIHVALTLSPIRDAFGKVGGISTIARDITERKRADEQIRQSETKYRTLIQNIQAAVVVHGADTQILVSNSMAQEILGLSEDQLSGKMAVDPDWHFFREDGKAAPLDEYPVNRVLASHLPLRNMVLGVHRPGRENDVWLLVNADPVLGKDGEIVQVIVTFIDISERKQAEVRLARMNERITLATRAAELGVWDWDIPNNKLIWDDRMYALYGIRREDFAEAYDAWLQGVHPDDRARGNEEIQQALRGEGEFDTEFRVLWPDGSVHFIRAYSLVVRDAEGKPLRMTGVNFDITERKQAEETLRREQALLNRIMVTSPVGIAVVSKEGQVTFANPQAEKILGLSKEKITQLSYNAPEWHSTAIDGGPFPDEAQPFSRVMATRQPVFDVQHAIAWPDGRRVLLSINGAPLFDARGEIEGVAFAIEDVTRRRLAEDELRNSERRYRIAQIIGHVGNWEYNIKTAQFWGSDEAKRIYGFDPEQPGFSTDEVEVCIVERERVHQALIDLIEKGQPYDLEFEIRPRDSSAIRIISSKADLKRDEDGNPEVVMGVIQDITERKQAEEKLRSSEHGLSEAQRIAHLGNWELDLVKNVLTWSDEIYRIFEINPKKFDASYEAFLNAIHPEDRDMVNKAYTDSVKNKVPYDISHRLQMPDGRIKYVNEKCETYYGADGKPNRSVGTVHDITDRKQDELALLEQQSHSNSLLRLSRQLERAQTYSDVLHAAREEVKQSIGYQNLWVYQFSEDRKYASALAGEGGSADKGISDAGTPRLTIKGDRMLEQIAQAKEIVIIEDALTSDIVDREIVSKLGNRTIVNVPILLFDRHMGSVGMGTFGDEGVRIPNEAEQKYLLALASHMAVALDRIYLLNERRKAEQAVQELNRDLEQRVDERTEQLAVANQELESFSYSVSHDLRSPLRAIDGFSHLLLDDYTDKLDDEGKRMLGIVRDNTRRMGQLIDDILKFSRSGRSEINAVEVDMAALAREVLGELQIGVAKVAGLHCEIGELPPVNCDRAMMHQVFANLISNALKFSRTRETPTIEVGGSVQGDEIVYHVRDNGVGFDMQYADKLFGVFQRLHSMEEFEGTGIGLAIVKRIVTRHGGRVWAVAKVNEGATVYFTLPRGTS